MTIMSMNERIGSCLSDGDASLPAPFNTDNVKRWRVLRGETER